MPGRAFLEAGAAEVADHFAAGALPAGDAGPPSDLQPGRTVLAVVSRDGSRRLAPMRWGLIPMGRTNARGRPVLDSIVHARGETVFTKPAFAGLRRCLVPVSGWYEWTRDVRRRTWWSLSVPGQPLLAFAAIWDSWRPPGGGPKQRSLATVTCAPSAEVARLHDRMPVIVEPGGYALWLGEAPGDPASLLRPLADGRIAVAAAGDPGRDAVRRRRPDRE